MELFVRIGIMKRKGKTTKTTSSKKMTTSRQQPKPKSFKDNNRTFLVGPSFSGKTYLMLKILSRIPNRDFYVITKSPPEQYSNSKMKIKELGDEKNL